MLKKVQYNSPVILSFSFLSFAVLLLGLVTQMRSTMLLFAVYRSSLTDILFYIRLFTHVLGHIDIEHFFGNFMIILLVGPILEEKYGTKNMIAMILITAVVTGLLNILLFDVALLGASGIAFMLILLSSFTNLQKGRVPLTLLMVIVIFLGKEMMDGLFQQDNISQVTHIIGGICGGIFGARIQNK